jgi:hypothetical protein
VPVNWLPVGPDTQWHWYSVPLVTQSHWDTQCHWSPSATSTPVRLGTYLTGLWFIKNRPQIKKYIPSGTGSQSPVPSPALALVHTYYTRHTKNKGTLRNQKRIFLFIHWMSSFTYYIELHLKFVCKARMISSYTNQNSSSISLRLSKLEELYSAWLFILVKGPWISSVILSFQKEHSSVFSL